DNGDLLWKTTVGLPYWSSEPAGVNDRLIFVNRRRVLHVLDRTDGSQRVFTYQPASKVNTLSFEMSIPPNAAPGADGEFLYVPTVTRVNAYLIPDFQAAEKRRKAREKGAPPPKIDPRKVEEEDIDDGPDSPQPEFYWGFRLGDQVTTS